MTSIQRVPSNSSEIIHKLYWNCTDDFFLSFSGYMEEACMEELILVAPVQDLCCFEMYCFPEYHISLEGTNCSSFVDQKCTAWKWVIPRQKKSLPSPIWMKLGFYTVSVEILTHSEFQHSTTELEPDSVSFDSDSVSVQFIKHLPFWYIFLSPCSSTHNSFSKLPQNPPSWILF